MAMINRKSFYARPARLFAPADFATMVLLTKKFLVFF